MNQTVTIEPPLPSATPVDEVKRPDSGLAAIAAIAGYFRIASNPDVLARDLALSKPAGRSDLLRAAKLVGLKAKHLEIQSDARLATLPTPAVACLTDGRFAVFGGAAPGNSWRIIDPTDFSSRNLAAHELLAETSGHFILLQRRLAGPGASRGNFGFRWFLPSIWRYRQAFAHVLLASLIVQIFALVTPLFFQVVVDKVLAHRSYSTLIVLVIGLAAVGLFDVVLQYLRTYALSHTTNRIDVELGRRLFRHMLTAGALGVI